MEEGLQEIQRGTNEPTATVFYWSSNATKLLIDLYQKYRSKVGSMRMKNFKSMWDGIAKELSEQLQTEISAKNCENRWKVLDRNYKKWVDNKNLTGRGRKHFEFAEEMQVIYAPKRNVHPEITLGSDTQHVPVNVIEENLDETVFGVAETPTRAEVQNSVSRGDSLRRRVVKKRKTVLEQIREDKVKYQNARLDFLREAHRETMALLQERNELDKERNKILQERKCRCDNV